MMNTKKLRGKDGELALIHKGTVFAQVERFVATLTEQTTLANTAKIGTYSIGTGYKASLHLSEVSITDDNAINDIMNDLNNGVMPELGFQGKFQRSDNLSERIVFRNCSLSGELDYTGFIKGFVWDIDLSVSGLTDEQIKQFQTHG